MDAAEIAELFAPFGPVSVRRMFGGHGVYADGLCFALQVSGEIFLKGDAATQAAFEAAGSTPWVYERNGKSTMMGYWRLVESAFDDEDMLRQWAGSALSAARRAAAAKAARGVGKPAAKAARAKSKPAPRGGAR